MIEKLAHGARAAWIRQLRALTLADWRLLVEALVTLVSVHIALRVVRFPALLAWTARSGPDDPAKPSASEVAHTARITSLASRILRFPCLTRSLTLVRLLARRRTQSRLRIGVRREDGRLIAHAWVEWMGRPLDDSPANVRRFTDLTIGDTSHG